jgi:hypothetical protein
VRTPEEALEAARRRAAERRTPESAQPEAGDAPIVNARAASLRRLAQWAIIEPEETEVYSTRKFGAPITVLKRGLIRLMRQYLVQITAQQSRFNAELAAHVMALDERLSDLERRAGAANQPDAQPPTTR